MSRKSQHTLSKRQREQKKAEKVAHKAARREERKVVETETLPASLGDEPAGLIVVAPQPESDPAFAAASPGAIS